MDIQSIKGNTNIFQISEDLGIQTRQDENAIVIDDAQASATFTDDIDDMPNLVLGTTINTANNYTYDAEGRLVKDTQEEIALVEWRVDGRNPIRYRIEDAKQQTLERQF